MCQSVIIIVYSSPSYIQSKYFWKRNIKNCCIIKTIKAKIRKEHIYEKDGQVNLNKKLNKYNTIKSPSCWLYGPNVSDASLPILLESENAGWASVARHYGLLEKWQYKFQIIDFISSFGECGQILGVTESSFVLNFHYCILFLCYRKKIVFQLCPYIAQ